MTGKGPGTGGKDAFIAELQAFHGKCGAPSYHWLAAISLDLPRLYPAPEGAERHLVTLSVSAISEILAGKRQRLPTFDWVASFVLGCQRWAVGVGVAAHDPGTSSLPEWASRRAAHAEPAAPAAAGAGRDSPPGQRGGAGPVSRVPLPPQQRAFIANHGPYGAALLSHAQAGNPDAIYRVALLLGTDAALREDAEALLLYAAAAGHPQSFDLLDSHPATLPPREVARHARDLARIAEANGHHDQAHAFHQAAARARAPASPRQTTGWAR